MRNADLWWHLAAGRAIWAERSLPRLDPFSFPEQTRAWLNHEWLADVVFFLWQATFGIDALVGWLLLAYVATYVLLFRLLLKRGANPLVAAFATISALALVRPFIELRPHVYSLLGTVLLLTWLNSPNRRLVPLWLLFLVWANTHGGVIFGLALVILWSAVELAIRQKGQPPAQWWIGGVALLASVLTPHGVEGLLFPLRYALQADWPYLTLKEWLPPFGPNAVEVAALPAFLLGFAGAALWVVRRSVSKRDLAKLPSLAVALLTLAMALRSARFVPLLGIGGALLLADVIRWQPAFRPPARRTALRPAVLLPVLLLTFAGLMLTRYRPGPGLFAILTTESSFPVDIVDFADRKGLNGRVYAFFGWGGYLHWRTNGDLRVAIDSRADTVFGAQDYLDYVRVQYGLAGWLDVVERSGAQFFLWPHPTEQVRWAGQARELLATGRWRTVREDFAGVLLARDGAIPVDTEIFDAEPSAASDSPYAILGQARAAMLSGNEVLSAQLLRRVLELQPNSRVACHNLALVQVRQGDFGAARATDRECQAIFPIPMMTRQVEDAVAARRRTR